VVTWWDAFASLHPMLLPPPTTAPPTCTARLTVSTHQLNPTNGGAAGGLHC
jgi:hypothetical protein